VGVSDEFDNENDAPLPPHERTWRHPAEVSNAMRRDHALRATPPPIGRRATALVAFVSIVASATLMLVTVQKGVSDPVAEPTETTTTSLPSKTGGAGDVVPAVRAFADFYVVPTSALKGDATEILPLEGNPFDAEVVTTIATKGISIVRDRSTKMPSLPLDAEQFDTPDDAESFVAVDRTGHRFTVHPGLESGIMSNASSTSGTGNWHPLDVDGIIDGVATLSADNYVYAIAVRHDHMHFGILLADLATIVNDAIAARNG